MLYGVGPTGVLSKGVRQMLIEDALSLIDDNRARVTYSGKWQSFANSAYEGGTMMIGMERGAAAEVVFYGTEAIWIADRHMSRGKADVYVDGAYKATIDLYKSPAVYKQEVFHTGVLAEGVHRIRIEATGDKDPNASNPFISFDALRVKVNDFALTHVTAGALLAGTSVEATSPRSGTMYVVPAATVPSRTAIEAAAAGTNGRSAPIAAAVPATVQTTGLAEGWYAVYVIDSKGIVSRQADPFAVLATAKTRLEDDDALVRYTGAPVRVENTAYSGGTMRLVRTAEEAIEIPFQGTGATLIADIHRARGKGAISVDGVYVTTVDFYGPVIQYKQTLFDTGTLPAGAHTIRIEPTGEKHPDSSNTYVSFDALQVR